jgi:hypothetical protein
VYTKTKNNPEIIVTPQPFMPTAIASGASGKIANFFWGGLLLFILFYCWTNGSSLFYIILGLGLMSLLSKFFKNSRAGRWLPYLLWGAVIVYLLSIFLNNKEEQQLVETRDGNIKVSPPKENNQTGGKNDKDYSNEKEIEWFDFINNHYLMKYATSSLTFFDSKNKHTQLSQRINTNSAIGYYTDLYGGLLKLDDAKIRSVVDSFRHTSSIKKLRPEQVAEMVITFVQEIPYYLVHEGTCEQAVSGDNNGFVTQYHREKRPCLGDVSGGVQSPYEFLHNLKGDCDTRSLLAFSILKQLGISCSVWVSDVYGHSILGVGLPAGYGIHKSIDGLAHYGVELTAKGFRLGMVAPDNNNPANWDITVYYNNN